MSNMILKSVFVFMIKICASQYTPLTNRVEVCTVSYDRVFFSCNFSDCKQEIYDKFKYLPSLFVSFTSWMLISLVTKPTDKSLVEATSNRHSWSFPHWSSAFCLKLSLCHVMLSANIGSKSGFEKLATLSLSPYVNKDWDWLICPEKNCVEDL